MSSVYVIGTSCTPFGKLPDKSFKDLTREAYLQVLADAGLDDGGAIEQGWFGNCGMGSFGQANIRGQVCFTPLVREGRFPERVPMINVEGGCATASMAFHGAWKDVLSGQSELSLAIGVEKTFVPNDPQRTQEIFEGGIDQLDRDEWMAYYAKAGEIAGKPFAPNAGGGTVFMDTYAMQAAYHMKTFGTTQRQIAAGAAKNHAMGAKNPLAQYRFEVSPEQVLADGVVSFPLTRAMCAPIGDGAAAALLCSERFLAGLPARVCERAVKVRASTLSGGKYRALDEPGLSRVAAERAYAAAGRRRTLRRIGRRRAWRQAAGQPLRRPRLQGPPGGRHGPVHDPRARAAAAQRGGRAPGRAHTRRAGRERRRRDRLRRGGLLDHHSRSHGAITPQRGIA